ncbi:hypothetical protein ABXT70_13755 [Candidatus Njordibacter sp. Uisw_039]|uniref:hypothetical protein n=1 Tax=Candidatus Njordibacter sp. Uisw_039 TaxID=3230972 RepID=UPI003D4F4618
MNIVTKSTLLLTVTLVTGLISIQSHSDVFGGSGQYAMMQYHTQEYGSIWILDTETGKVRLCSSRFNSDREFGKPYCAPWSEE